MIFLDFPKIIQKANEKFKREKKKRVKLALDTLSLFAREIMNYRSFSISCTKMSAKIEFVFLDLCCSARLEGL